MSDFVSGFWSYFIAIIALGGIAFCIWLLFSQRAWLKKTVAQAEDTGHVWDGNLTELNNPVPRWWTVMYLGLCVIALGLLSAVGYGPKRDVAENGAEAVELLEKSGRHCCLIVDLRMPRVSGAELIERAALFRSADDDPTRKLES